ncbi:MAG: TraC family protein [Maricaulaceae bacterium]
MIKGLIKGVSDFVDAKLFGGHIPRQDLIAVHSPAQVTDCLPYRSYDDDKEIFYNEESVGVVFEIQPLLGVDERIYNMLNSVLSRSVPNALNLQLMTYSSPKIGTVLDHFGYKARAPHSIYHTVAAHRVRHFQNGVWNTLSKNLPFHLRYHRVIISASILFTENSDAERDIMEFAELLQNTLKQISPQYLRYQPLDLIRLTSDIMNPTKNYRPSSQKYDSLEDINFQIMSPDTRYRVNIKDVLIQTVGRPDEMSAAHADYSYDEQEFVSRTLEAKNLPIHMGFGDMAKGIGDMFSPSSRHLSPVIMSLNIYYPPEGDSKAMAQIKHIRATNNAASPVARYMPEMKAKAKDWEYASEALTHGARMVQVNFQCTVIAPIEDIDSAERSSRNLFDAMNFEMRRSDRIHYPAMLFGLPMGMGTSIGKDMRRLKRLKLLPSVMLPHAAPIFGEFLGSSNPVLLLSGRCGQPYMWDNFSNVGAGNHNLTVTAESGGGKSVLLNETVFGTCANGGHAIIFDDGYSFKNHCLLVGGNHYRFSLNDDFGLNVFDMVDYVRAERDDEYKSMCVEMCKAVIVQMIFAQRVPTKEEKAVLEECILHVMRKYKGEGNIDDVRQYLMDMDDSELQSNTKSMAKAISSYCTDGVFGKFFNHRNTLDVSKHMTVFELSPLEQKPDLRAVILTALLFMTDQKMVSSQSRRDLAVIDEAHKHIGNDNVCDVLQGWARRLRKYNSALMLATQGAADFNISNDAKAIFENCGWKIVLKTSTAGVEAAADMRIFPDEFSKRCARNIYVSKGEYSEAVIIGGGSYSLGRLVLDPFSISLFTSTAEDVTQINNLQKQGVSLEQAIYSVSGVKPLHVGEDMLEAAQ